MLPLSWPSGFKVSQDCPKKETSSRHNCSTNIDPGAINDESRSKENTKSFRGKYIYLFADCGQGIVQKNYANSWHNCSTNIDPGAKNDKIRSIQNL